MESMKQLKRAVFLVTAATALLFFIACGGGSSAKDPGKNPPDPPQYVTVPDVVGKTEAVAVSTITSAGLTVGAKTYEYNDDVPSGSIIRQNPTGGTSALKLASVSLWISKGPAPQYVTVPDVVGKMESAAESTITSAGLTVGTKTYEYNDDVPSGSIIRQNPTEGTSALELSSVSLWISKGPAPQYVTVPDVVGMTEAVAEAAITNAGLTIGTKTYEYDDDALSGSVIRQSPKEGTSALELSSVSLWISKGPAVPPDPPNPPEDPTFDDPIIEGLVFVEGGEFLMGCVEGGGTICNFYKDELPVHSVKLSDFYIGKYEVTQKQWFEVMGTDIHQQCAEIMERPCVSTDLFGVGDDYPMYYVSWNDVQEFIKIINDKTGMEYRLPTEAEWEFAARGGNKSKGYIYSGSNNPDEVAWYNESQTHPVGTRKANELGIHDMSGNVSEMVSDWFGPYSSSPQVDPKGPDASSIYYYSRVALRGGDWYSQRYVGGNIFNSFTELIRVSFRGYYQSYNPDGVNLYEGFRLAHGRNPD